MTLTPTIPEQPNALSTYDVPLVQGLPCLVIGGLPIALQTRAEAARHLVRVAAGRVLSGLGPLYATSANGEVLARVETEPDVRALFEAADLIHVDSQVMVLVSRLLHRRSFPERVATTDFFHDVARVAENTGTSFYLLGGAPEVMTAAVAAIGGRYPGLRIAGARHGYFGPDEEDEVVEAIVRARPDILWVGMGVPLEQAFVLRNRARLTGVGVVKTAGGLFDFLSGRRSRAPLLMQKVGLEWLYRMLLEPRRLGPRYMLTSPRALAIMVRSPRLDGSRRETAKAEGLRP